MRRPPPEGTGPAPGRGPGAPEPATASAHPEGWGSAGELEAGVGHPVGAGEDVQAPLAVAHQGAEAGPPRDGAPRHPAVGQEDEAPARRRRRDHRRADAMRRRGGLGRGAGVNLVDPTYCSFGWSSSAWNRPSTEATSGSGACSPVQRGARSLSLRIWISGIR